MQAVVIAAGDGGRLYPLTSLTPKPLINVAGRPMINHVLDALAAGGVDDATIVVGYRGGQVRDAVDARHPRGMTVRFVQNEAFLLGNARSIWEARAAVDGSFILAMADHLIDASLVRTLAANADGRCRLAVEHCARTDVRAQEATRARVHGNRVTDLGKTISDWNALDTGVFWCTPRVFDELTPSRRDGEAGAMFAALAHAGGLDAIDVTGQRWIDVDTIEDLVLAEELLAPLAPPRYRAAHTYGADGRIA
jgi:1L-myo-inositol 1-phosphate cytidylyltransferase